jgi:hypothetical protein
MREEQAKADAIIAYARRVKDLATAQRSRHGEDRAAALVFRDCDVQQCAALTGPVRPDRTDTTAVNTPHCGRPSGAPRKFSVLLGKCTGNFPSVWRCRLQCESSNALAALQRMSGSGLLLRRRGDGGVGGEWPLALFFAWLSRRRSHYLSVQTEKHAAWLRSPVWR